MRRREKSWANGWFFGPLTIGKEIYALAADILPIRRSIAGSGVRQTLEVLGRHVPIERQNNYSANSAPVRGNIHIAELKHYISHGPSSPISSSPPHYSPITLAFRT